MYTKQARGNGNTQVGQSLNHESIRIDHCTINIFLKNRRDFERLKQVIENFKKWRSKNEDNEVHKKID